MEATHICPWWMGYFLLSPLRKFMQDPEKILGPYIKPGMKVIDYGSAMGYFSLPMARMVGDTGKVHCFDIQEKMLDKLNTRAVNAGLGHIIEPHLIKENKSFGYLKQSADFALLFAVAHEVPDREQLFSHLFEMMKNKSILFFAEPAGHVSMRSFAQSVSLARKAGYSQLNAFKISRSHVALFEKK